MRSTLVAPVAALLALVAAGTACSSDGPGETAPAALIEDTTTLVSTDLGAGWSLDLPEGLTVEGAFPDPAAHQDGCTVDAVVVSNGTLRTAIALVDSVCTASAYRGNGEPAEFGRAQQLYDGENVETVATPLGDLTIATVSYYECTNDCDYYKPVYGLIELEDPGDSTPRSVLIGNGGAATLRDDIKFIARNLTHD